MFAWFMRSWSFPVPTLMPEIANLTLAERIQLVEDLWDSIAAEAGGALPLS